MNPIGRAIVKLLLFTLVLVALVAVLGQTSGNVLHSQVWYMLLFFFVLTLITMIIVMMNANPEMFITIYLATVVMRLVLSAGVAFIFLYFTPGQEVIFVTNFFSFYLLFLLFEIIALLSILRAGN